jgi:DNA-binding transcriptional LysR family regulator
MDTAELEIFRTVAYERSITRAAHALNRAQSNVTTRVQQLEEELGVTLFLRQNKRMDLTPQGERFLAYAEQLLATAEEARQSLHQDVAQGVLRIGSMESAAAARLPKPLVAFHAENPRVKVELTTGPTDTLVNGVLGFKLDCAVVAHPLDGHHQKIQWDEHDPNLDGTYLFTERLMLVTPTGFRMAKRKGGPNAITTVAAFSNGCTYRRCADEWIASRTDTSSGAPWSVLEVSSYHAILACVASGSAVGVLPQSVLDLYQERIPLEALFLRPVHSFLVRRKGYATPAYNAFLEAIRSRS